MGAAAQHTETRSHSRASARSSQVIKTENTVSSLSLLISVLSLHCRKVAFVPHSTFVVGYTTTHLIVWNLLTCTVWWSHKAYVTSLTVDPHSPRFAVSLGTNERKQNEEKGGKGRGREYKEGLGTLSPLIFLVLFFFSFLFLLTFPFRTRARLSRLLSCLRASFSSSSVRCADA